MPEEGDFVIQLKARATDPSGISLEAQVNVQFDGEVVEIGGGYNGKLAACMRWLHEKLSQYVAVPPFPTFPPPIHGNSEKLVSLIYATISTPVPEADEYLAQLIVQYGPSHFRALASPAAARAGQAGKGLSGGGMAPILSAPKK